MDLFKMMGQFKDMQSRMQTMQDEMSQRTFSALAGGGMVAADFINFVRITKCR